MKYLVLMVKEPRLGRVKSRLGCDIGNVAACWWFRHQTAQLLRRLKNPRWQIILAVSPDRAGFLSRVWPTEFTRWPQGRGNLGKRMRKIFTDFPPGEVVIIGADIPAIRPFHIVSAFKALGAHDAVFGPSFDGGYWLVGLKRKRRIAVGSFENVRWSSQYALRDTLDSFKGQRITFVDRLRDIDRACDLSNR